MIKVVERVNLSELAQLLEGVLHGEDRAVCGISSLDSVREGEIVWVENSRTLDQALKSSGVAVILSKKLFDKEKDRIPLPCILVENPRLAFARALDFFYRRDLPGHGISSRASIHKSVHICKEVYVGEFTVIGEDTRIGPRAVIYPHVYIGSNVEIGENTLIYPFASIHGGTRIGKNSIIHSGAVIGGDGFGFVDDGSSKIKIPQVGVVEIGDNVEIGANVTIDRATTGVTRIGDGSKIDNLVQIGHNCILGKNCIMVSQSGIAGSCVLGDNVTFAAQAGAAPHIRVGSNTIVAGRGGVTHDIPGNTLVSGFPAKPHREALRISGAVQLLPHYIKTIQELEKRLEFLESRLKHEEIPVNK